MEDRTRSEAAGLPDRIGHYRVLSRLGAGGMGEVFLAEDERLERQVAIKRLLPGAEDGGRLLTEARAVARLEHPNICAIYEVGEDRGTPFIVMPVADGQTLAAKLASGELPLGDVLAIAVQIADAVAAAHAQGILHRDIKPANVMVGLRGRARVMDFGLAKFTRASAALETAARTADMLTMAGTTLGTAAYMSPEQARGEAVDARSDLFSLGVVVYEMVAGRRPFEGPSLAATLIATQTSEPAPLAERRPGAPDELQRIVSKLLRKSPDDRYQSASDLVVDLRALQRTLETPATTARSTEGVAPLLAGRRMSPVMLAGVAVFAVVALAALAAALSHDRASSHAGVLPQANAAITSLAVLPLVNQSGNPEKEYVADGITESLIRSLSQVPKLSVLSRNTVFRFKGQTADAQNIAAKLGVNAVVTGTITKADDQLVVDIELSDARNARVILSRRYLQPASRAPAVETDIAQDVARNLQATLTEADRRQLTTASTGNADAYQLYLKGRFDDDLGTPESIHRAVASYSQAVALDPNYALAYAGLAQVYLELGLYFEAPKEVMPLAKSAAQRAIAANPDLNDGRILLGLVNLTYDWDWKAAATATTRNGSMVPEAVAIFTCATHLLQSTGHSTEADGEIHQALALDPLSVPLNTELGCNAYYRRKYDDSVRGYLNALVLDPNNVVALWGLGKALDQQQKYTEALAELGKVSAGGGQAPPIIVAEMGCAYAGAGRSADTRRVLDTLASMAKQIFVDPYLVATVYMALDDKAQAFEWLDKAYAVRSSFMVSLEGEPKWDPVRSDPRFKALVKRVGF